MRIRAATDDDLLALARIFSTSAEHLTARYRPELLDQFPVEPEGRLPTYRHLLRTGTIVVAEDPDPVGFAAAVVRDGVWFLSQLWVLPEWHGGGVGAALLDEALTAGRGCRAFTVVASPHPAAQTLYLRASMYPLYSQIDVTGSPPPPDGPGPEVRPIEDRDGSWRDELDREVRGIARPEDHAWWIRDARGIVVERAGTPLGYVYVWEGGKIGPGAARTPGDATQLLDAARRTTEGPISIAVPSTNWTALRELVRLGLTPVGANTFMSSRPLGDASRYLSSGGALG